ncbi:MAG: WD40/YVTN/BNR-like repeat-containing protein, partial [Gemmataceae bacterium]
MNAIKSPVAAAVLLCSLLPLHAESVEGGPEAYKRLKFRSIGPAIGGRVCRACGVPGQSQVYYAATAAGGLWKTVDGGWNWKPIMDEVGVSSVGSIAISPSDPNVIYVGSGEANIRGNVERGQGIFKSTDAGKTWTHTWKQEAQIGSMVVHPTNPDIAYAAVLGKIYGPSPERGIYRTKDGGNTWQRILFRNDDTGASDLAMDPNNPRLLFAGLWQTRRFPWNFTSGGPGSGLYYSKDGGDSWTQLLSPPQDNHPNADKEASPGTKYAEGLPEGIWGKIGIAIAPSDSHRVYALIEAEKGGLFRSDDGGVKWSRVNSNRILQQRAWYYSTLTVHPRNADVVFFPQVPLLKTIDGGKTLSKIKGTHHGDHHDLWIDPKNPERMIDSNDGGVDISVDGGNTWTAPPLPIGQIYHVSADNRKPYHLACSFQDIGTLMGPSHDLNGSENGLSSWHSVGGGEAGHIAIDPVDPNIVYAGEYGGYISRYDHRTRQATPISIYPFNPSGHGAEILRYRFQWTAPILISPHDHQTVYHAANVLFKTTSAGRQWEKISEDLTRNDRTKQLWSGGPITGDNTGVEVYGTIFALSESPKQKGLIWAGTDDGKIHITRNGGKDWNDVTRALQAAGAPEWGTITCIESSPFDSATAFLVMDAHRLDDPRPLLFMTSDFGNTWKSIVGDLKDSGFLQVIREDPKNKNLLFLGSETGLFLSRDAGNSWTRLKLNFPRVRVTDLLVKDDDLVVATNGRSLWILDDLTALRIPEKQWRDNPLHLFPPQEAYRYRRSGRSRPDHPMASGKNPDKGVAITYYIKKRPEKELFLEIVDSQGKVVRKLTSKKDEPETSDLDSPEEGYKSPVLPTSPGLHRISWDLLAEGAEKIRGSKLDMGDPKPGPFVLPGEYKVRLSSAGNQSTARLIVRLDSRVSVQEQNANTGTRDPKSVLITPENLTNHFQFVISLRDDISAITRTVNYLRSVRKQVSDRVNLLGEEKKSRLHSFTKNLLEKLETLEEELHNPKA